MCASSGVDRGRAPTLLPAALCPLTVRGTDFAPRERIRVTVAVGETVMTRRIRASGRGDFTATFGSADACSNGVDAMAVGRRGSRASFQLSATTCGGAPGP